MVCMAFSLLAKATEVMDLTVAYVSWGAMAIMGTVVSARILLGQKLNRFDVDCADEDSLIELLRHGNRVEPFLSRDIDSCAVSFFSVVVPMDTDPINGTAPSNISLDKPCVVTL
jgi:hypothetical protein